LIYTLFPYTTLFRSGGSVLTNTAGASGRTFPGVAHFSIAGGLDRGTSFTLDGANHNDVRQNAGLPLPFPDALQEFKVETNAVPADRKSTRLNSSHSQ